MPFKTEVNSENCTQRSSGTSAWIAEHGRLLARWVADTTTRNPAELREAMDICFGLLGHIAECRDGGPI